MMRTLPLLLLLACGTPGDDLQPLDPGGDAGGGDGGDEGGSGTGGDTGDGPWELEWDAACNPLALPGASDCVSPFPSTWNTVADPSSPTGVRLAMDRDQFTSPDGELPVDPAILDGADGFSPVTPVLITFGRDVHEAHLSGHGEQEDTVQPGADIALIHAETGEAVPLLTEMDQSNRELEGYEDRHPLILRPLAPLEFGATYHVLLSGLTDAAGEPLESPDVFVALRDDIETTDETVEAMRPDFEALFEAAEAAGWPREDLTLAFSIPVASEEYVLGPARSARQQVLDLAAEGLFSYTVDEVEVDPNENLAWLVKGTFTPPSFLTETNSIERDDAGGLVLQGEPEDWPSYDFTLAIPPQGSTEGGLPVVVLGHGLFGNGRSMVDSGSARTYTQPLAAELGAVLVATDWIGLSSGDLSLIIDEVLTDPARLTLITDRLVQSHASTLALAEMVAGGLADEVASGRAEGLDPLVDPEAFYYYGISLGGIQGSGQVALSPRISRGVLAVPGAGWSHMIQRSTNFEAIELYMDALYPDPMLQNVLIATLQSFFDASDPANLVHLLDGDETFEGELPEKVVVFQEAIGDCQVPNIATDLLVRAVGAGHLEEATDPVYGLETLTGPTTEPALTQIRVPEDLDAYFPPDENTIPETDNGVHNSAVLQDATFAQIGHLFVTGEIIHPCEGPCDPD